MFFHHWHELCILILVMPLEKITCMSTLQERINNYLGDQMSDGRLVKVAGSTLTEYEYLRARTKVTLQNVKKRQDKPKRGLAQGVVITDFLAIFDLGLTGTAGQDARKCKERSPVN
jgi:hypothetical protein